MFCKSCGNKIDDDSAFCSYCGSKQSELNKPLLTNNESTLQVDPKTINVNLSFGRQGNLKNNQQTESTYAEPKFDSTYKKETEATTVGVIILIATLVITIFQPFEFDSVASYNGFQTIFSVGALLLRIFATIWVVSISKKQNRNTLGWGIFAFILPSIALIIIGLLKKLFLKFNIDGSLSNEENSIILTEKAQDLLNNAKYNDCIRFTEKAIELDKNNKSANDLLLKAQLQTPVSEIANKHTQVVYRETRDKQILKIVSNNYQTIGASVFINDEIAPDGEYFYLVDNRILTVKNGKIEQIKN